MSEVRHALAEALGIRTAEVTGPTVTIDGAAKLLHVTPRAVYIRRSRGKMPTPITRRPLVWRTADVLAMQEDERADRVPKRKTGS